MPIENLFKLFTQMTITWTDIGAFIGAISGISSLTWNYLRWKDERPKLIIKASIGKKDCWDQNDLEILFVQLSNYGKRPINIMQIRGKHGRENFSLTPYRLPHVLHEAESVEEVYPLDLMSKITHKKITNLYAIDVTDRRWEVSQNEIRVINEDISKWVSTHTMKEAFL
ncbi:MAG: hypothetical protein AB9917_13545 [Negativicutes bacterium]